MPKKPASTIIQQPFIGLALDAPPWNIDPRAFSACNNVRITNGRVTSALMGWTNTGATFRGKPITLIADFPNNNNNTLVIGTTEDLYNYNNGTPLYLTPIYNTGTVNCALSTAVTGNFTTWNQPDGTLAVRNNVMPGDQISFANGLDNDPTHTWYTIATVNSDTSLTLTTAGPLAGTQAYTIRKLAQGNIGINHWDFEIFPQAAPPLNGDTFFCTNGSDPVVTWTPGDVFAKYQSSMPFLCFELRRFKNLMIYGSLVYQGQSLPTSIANSDNGNPLNLTTGVAGQYVVSDGPYPINWLGVLGNNLMIYMGSMEGGSVVAASFVGLPTNFIFTEVIRGRGPIASRLVIEFPDHHEFVGFDGQYRYNGLYVQQMNVGVWNGPGNVIDMFDRSRADQAFTSLVPQYGSVHFSLPLQTDATAQNVTAYIENYLEGENNQLFKPMTQRDFPFTAAGQVPKGLAQVIWETDVIQWDLDPARWNDSTATGSYAQQFVGDINGNLYTLFTADTQDGTAYLSTVTFAQRITVNERSRGLVKRIYPFIEYVASGYNLTVTIQIYDQLGGAVWATTTGTMAMDYSGNRFTSPFRRGRSFDITFSTPGPDQPWTMDGYDVDIIAGGLR